MANKKKDEQLGSNAKAPATTDDSAADNESGFNWRSLIERPSGKYRVLELIAIIFTICAGAAFFLVYFGIIPERFYSSVPPPTTARRQFTVLVPLASNSNEYNAFMQEKDGTFKEKYNNQASQNIRDIVKVAKSQWLKDNPTGNLKETNIDFFCFPEGFDQDETSFGKAFDHAIEIVRGQGREIVGLLGNVSSTSTLVYGQFCSRNYYPKKSNGNVNTANNINSETSKVNNSGIPMILPLATATSLMKNLDLKGVPAVLRLPPANDKQAENISTFLLKNKVLKTVILKDLTNETYSTDLIENFREDYVQKQLSTKSSTFGEIVGTIPIGGKETSPFLYSALSGGETGLVIAGMTNSAIETLAQANASNSQFNSIILTDGAVDEYLGKRIKRIQNSNSLTNLYLSFPSQCPLDNALAGYISNESALQNVIWDFQFTHALYVADGAYIIMSVLEKEISRSAKSGAEILIDFINGLKETAEKNRNDWIKAHEGESVELAPKSVTVGIRLPFSDVSKRDYLIDKFGNNTNSNYFLFKLDGHSNWEPFETNPTSPNCYIKKAP